MKLNIKKFKDLNTNELYNILKLRSQVFIVEFNCAYQDLDGKDLNSIHFYITNRGEVVSYLRAVKEDNFILIGRVIVDKKYRGKGISEKLLNEAIKYIFKNDKYEKIKIEAQVRLEDYYNKFGFVRTSNNYLLDNLLHCDMELEKNENKVY